LVKNPSHPRASSFSVARRVSPIAFDSVAPHPSNCGAMPTITPARIAAAASSWLR